MAGVLGAFKELAARIAPALRGRGTECGAEQGERTMRAAQAGRAMSVSHAAAENEGGGAF